MTMQGNAHFFDPVVQDRPREASFGVEQPLELVPKRDDNCSTMSQPWHSEIESSILESCNNSAMLLMRVS
jgi:hypothetical protein